MTLKQSQGNQTYHENVDPEQGYNRAKFERSRYNSVPEEGNINFFQMRKYINYLPLTYETIKNSHIYS